MLAVTQDILKQLDLWSTAWHFYISHDFNLTINIYYRYYRSFSYSHIEKAIHAFICFGDYICYLFSGLNMKKLSFLPPIQNEVRMSRITSPGFSTVFLCPVYFGIYLFYFADDFRNLSGSGPELHRRNVCSLRAWAGGSSVCSKSRLKSKDDPASPSRDLSFNTTHMRT